jgi:hypothetical protein
MNEVVQTETVQRWRIFLTQNSKNLSLNLPLFQEGSGINPSGKIGKDFFILI